MLCAVYALIAIGALIATWSQNLAYSEHSNFLLAFANDTKVTPAARIAHGRPCFCSCFPALILMVAEARKHGVKYVWAYFLAGASRRSASRSRCS